MKKFILLLIIPFLSFGQQTYIPDDTFEQALINAGYDDVLDNYINTSNINTISSITFYATSIIIDGNFAMNQTVPPIFDLTGIQDFTLLQDLYIPSQYLSELDISNMIYLQNVDISENYLDCIDVTGCVSLSNLHVGNNFLTQLDVSTCISLKTVAWYQYENNPFLNCIEVGENANFMSYVNDVSIFQFNCNYDETLDCISSNVSIAENIKTKSLIAIRDLMGRETTNKGFQLHIYDDGSVEKKYIVNTK